MTNTKYPDPNTLYPIKGVTRTVYLKNIIKNPQIIVGDYTYYDDIENVNNFEKNVLYLFDFIKDRLIIGKFCQIATGVRFIMNGANHAMNGFSTYPFKVFGGEWTDKSNIITTIAVKNTAIIGELKKNSLERVNIFNNLIFLFYKRKPLIDATVGANIQTTI
jgi:acetyltransferase-like isoleucine patch superfamily enzyme